MNGPQHYKEAERLLPIAHDLADQDEQVRADFIVARAQVHATLAAAAATIDALPPSEPAVNNVWKSVTS